MEECISLQTTDVKRVISEYHKQLCEHKFNNLDEMDQILGRTSYQNSFKKT